MGYDAPYPDFSWSTPATARWLNARGRTTGTTTAATAAGIRTHRSPPRLACALKQLTSFPMIVGNVVHTCARDCAYTIRHGTPRPSLDVLMAQASDALKEGDTSSLD